MVYDYTCGKDGNYIGGSWKIYGIRNVSGDSFESVKTAKWYLWAGTTTPTGNAVCKMYEADGTTVADSGAAVSDEVDVSGVTATSGIGDPITFTFSSPATWDDDYYLVIIYTDTSAGGDAENKLRVVNSYEYNAGCSETLEANPDTRSGYYNAGASAWVIQTRTGGDPDPRYLQLNCVTTTAAASTSPAASPLLNYPPSKNFVAPRQMLNF